MASSAGPKNILVLILVKVVDNFVPGTTSSNFVAFSFLLICLGCLGVIDMMLMLHVVGRQTHSSKISPTSCGRVCFYLALFSPQNVVLRDALLALLAEERRKFMTGGGLCLKTVLQALLETREASLQVVEAITRYDMYSNSR